MTLDFEQGKIIVTPHELMLRFTDAHRLTLQVQTDAIQLMGPVLVVHDAQTRFSMHLGVELIQQISDITGIAVS